MGATGAAAGVGAKALLGAAATRTGVSALALKGTAKAMPVGSEILGLTAASSLVDGHVPTANDFLDNAGMIIGLKGMHKVGGAAYNQMRNKVVDKLYERWIENGENPKDVMEKAMHDPLVLQDILAERQRIEKGVEEVSQHPERGTADGKFDILATIKNDLKTFIINRGAAIVNKSGEVVVRGRELQRETGTFRNFGFSKMVFGKGMNAEQMAQLPIFLREYQPAEITERTEIYRIPNENGVPYKIVFNKDGGNAGKNVLVHMSLDKRSIGKKLSEKRGPDSQPPAIIQGEGYTAASPVETAGPNLSVNSITEKGGGVNPQLQALREKWNKLPENRKDAKPSS